MRGPKHPWGVIWGANLAFVWALHYWLTSIIHLSSYAGPGRIWYVTSQAFSLSLGFTWFWWYAYQKRKEQAGGELPSALPEKQSFLTREPFRRYRFLIIWTGTAGVVALVTETSRLVTGQPSLNELLLHTALFPSVMLGYMFALNWAAKPLFRRSTPETPQQASA